MVDDDTIDFFLEAYRDFKALPTKDKIREVIAEHNRSWAYDCRKAYLCGLMEDALFEAHVFRDRLIKGVMNAHPGLMEISQLRLSQCIERVLKLQGEIIAARPLKQDDPKAKDRITDDMIRRAREYPFENLMEFNRNHMAKCPFHEDSDPSMSLKNNRVRCFSCDESWDTIGYLMEKDGMTFVEAVRRLQ